VQLYSLHAGTTEVTIRCGGEVHTEDRGGIVDRQVGLVPIELYSRPTPLTTDPQAAAVTEEPEVVAAEGSLARVHALNRVLHVHMAKELGREPRLDDKSKPAPSAPSYATSSGESTPFVHRFLASVRHLGLPGRFVSGFVVDDDPPAESGQEEGPCASSHAWAEVWMSGLGWVGFDPVNAMCPNDGYIRGAVGVDGDDVLSMSGIETRNQTETTTISVLDEQSTPSAEGAQSAASQQSAKGSQSQSQTQVARQQS